MYVYNYRDPFVGHEFTYGPSVVRISLEEAGDQVFSYNNVAAANAAVMQL